MSKFIYERLWFRDFLHRDWQNYFIYQERTEVDFNNVYGFFGGPEESISRMLNKKIYSWLIKVNEKIMLLSTFDDQPLWLTKDWYLQHNCIKDADILIRNLNNDKERRIRHDPTEASSKHIENSS